MSETANDQGGKTRKRPAVKAAPRQAVSRVKATICLTTEASQRLSVHAAMLGMDRSELVELLVTRHLRRFVVSDRGGEEAKGGMAENANT